MTEGKEKTNIKQNPPDQRTAPPPPPANPIVMLELDRTTPEQYEKLKALGFPINSVSKHPTPTLAYTKKWFRKVAKIVLHVEINCDHNEPTENGKYYWWVTVVHPTAHNEEDKIQIVANDYPQFYNEWEEAESKGIDHCIEWLEKSADRTLRIAGIY